MVATAALSFTNVIVEALMTSFRAPVQLGTRVTSMVAAIDSPTLTCTGTWAVAVKLTGPVNTGVTIVAVGPELQRPRREVQNVGEFDARLPVLPTYVSLFG